MCINDLDPASPYSAYRPRRAFTLVELLVVIGIIALLISILLPALSKARESGNRVKCLSNVRQIVTGFVQYTTANRGFFPFNGSSGRTEDWIAWRTDVNDPWDAKPMSTHTADYGIAPYLNFGKNPQVMICPSDPEPLKTHARALASGKNYPFSYALNNLMTSQYAWNLGTGSYQNVNGYYNLIAAKITSVRASSDKILVFEEADSTIDDGNGSMWCVPAQTNYFNLVAIRHDRGAIKDQAAELSPTANIATPPNAEGKGVVGFCDGHADTLARRVAHTKYHCVPDVDQIPAAGANWP